MRTVKEIEADLYTARHNVFAADDAATAEAAAKAVTRLRKELTNHPDEVRRVSGLRAAAANRFMKTQE